MSTDRVVIDQARFKEAMAEFQRRIAGTFGVMVHDFSTGAELTWNHDEVFPTASTMKVPLLYEVYRQSQEGMLDLSSRVTLRPDQRVPGSGVLQHLDVGLQPTVRDLAELMTIVSDNYATDLLYNMVGRERLATTLAELGLEQTHLPHTTWQILCQLGGIDPHDSTLTYEELESRLEEGPHDADSGDVGNLEEYDRSSPADMVRLLELIEQGHGISDESRQAIIDILKHQNFNTIIPGRLPDDAGIETAHKTGSVRGVRNDVGIVYAPGVRYAIAIMSKDLDDATSAGSELAHLSRWVWDHVSSEVDS